MTQGNILIANSSDNNSWSTATYPNTTTINQILYSSAANSIGGLATANSAILTTNSSGVPTWSTSSLPVLNYPVTSVNHAASPYTVLATDQYLSVNTSGGVVSILLPNAPTTGRVIIIKNTDGSAATSNITVTTVGGVVTIDGSTSYTITVNYGAINVIFNGSSYEVF